MERNPCGSAKTGLSFDDSLQYVFLPLLMVSAHIPRGPHPERWQQLGTDKLSSGTSNLISSGHIVSHNIWQSPILGISQGHLFRFWMGYPKVNLHVKNGINGLTKACSVTMFIDLLSMDSLSVVGVATRSVWDGSYGPGCPLLEPARSGVQSGYMSSWRR